MMASVANGSFQTLLLTRNTEDEELKKAARRELCQNVNSVILNFKQRVDITSYEKLVYAVKNPSFSDEDLQQLITDIHEIVSITDESCIHFIEALLNLQWFTYGDKTTKEYQSFLIDLLCAHNYYVNYAIKNLVTGFKQVSENSKPGSGGVLSHKEKCWSKKIHGVLKILLEIIPMSSVILRQALSNLFPYLKRSTHEHEVYLYNLLKITKYQPEMRFDILLLIANRLVYLDVHAPRREIEDFEFQHMDEFDEPEIFSMDETYGLQMKGSMVHPIANTLDALLLQLFKYIHKICYHKDSSELNWDATKYLYQDLIDVFERVILPTYNIHHVQFILFYFCSFKVALAEAFLNLLWRILASPNDAPTIRQTAAMYISSFLARATFVPISILKNMIAKLSSWIHSYIVNQDGLDGINLDIRVHSVFFSVCQVLFYLIAFRHGDLVNTRRNLTFLQNLNLTRMVTCRLNPLKVCIPPVVTNFAAVTRTYQLAYCYTIIEHNSRNIIPVVYRDESGATSVLQNNECLETFFPFDPFLLQKSTFAIAPIYREYQAAQMSVKESPSLQETNNDEEDDFLIDQSPSTSSLHPDLFSYCSSPGFKHM